jgi:hypothetical protein
MLLLITTNLVQLSRNITRLGENLSMNITINNPASVKVSRVLIHLQQNETTTSLDLKGHRVCTLNLLSLIIIDLDTSIAEQNQHDNSCAMDLHWCK